MWLNRHLGRIAVYGAVITVSAGLFVNWKIQDNLKSSPYFEESLKLLKANSGAVSLLGEPVRSGYLDLGNTGKNFCDGYKAQFEVPVKGPKQMGTLFLWASRENPEQEWNVSRLELQMKNDASRRLIIKKDENIVNQ